MTIETSTVRGLKAPFASTIGTTVIGLAALLATAALTTPAFSAEPSYGVHRQLSEATKARMARGYWDGDAGRMHWQVGPDKPYVVHPKLSEATKARMRKGHWFASAAGSYWVPGPDSKKQ